RMSSRARGSRSTVHAPSSLDWRDPVVRDLAVRHARLVLVIALVLVWGAACSKAKLFRSNFATVQLVEGTIVTATSREPYTGTLVARDQEITAVATAVLGERYRDLDGLSPTGLVLVLPVDQGVPSGVATLY